MGGSARIVNVYFTTEEMDAINTLCKETTQTPQTIIEKSVMNRFKEIENGKSAKQARHADARGEKSEALTA